MIRVTHISDTHGGKYHKHLEIPEVDLLLHTGDIGGRTNLAELNAFLIWFEKQPAKVKIFCAGNHDLVLDKNFPRDQRKLNNIDSITQMLLEQQHKDALELIKQYDVTYLCDSSCEYEGIKIYGSPYSPSFHRNYWAFNADRGEEIQRIWSKIPSDVNILMTHTPIYGVMDDVLEYARMEEDPNVGCKDLYNVIKKRLFDLKLSCVGHIHGQLGVVQERISNTRRILCSNGAVLDNEYNILTTKPIIINI